MACAAAPVTQFDGHRLQSANCRAAALAWFIASVTCGAQRPTAGEVRDRMFDPVGFTGFGSARLALASFRVPYDAPIGGVSFVDFQRAMMAGRVATLDGEYGRLPAAFRLQPDFRAGHSVGLSNAGADGVDVMDPITRPASVRRWPWDVVRAFGWAGPFHGNVVLEKGGPVGAPKPGGGTGTDDRRCVWRVLGVPSSTVFTPAHLESVLELYVQHENVPAGSEVLDKLRADYALYLGRPMIVIPCGNVSMDALTQVATAISGFPSVIANAAAHLVLLVGILVLVVVGVRAVLGAR